MRYAHRWALRWEEKDEISQMREHAETDTAGHTDIWLERGVSGVESGGRSGGKTHVTPGKESLKKATKVTGSQLLLYSKWMAL